jgi:hypothetical protein
LNSKNKRSSHDLCCLGVAIFPRLLVAAIVAVSFARVCGDNVPIYFLDDVVLAATVPRQLQQTTAAMRASPGRWLPQWRQLVAYTRCRRLVATHTDDAGGIMGRCQLVPWTQGVASRACVSSVWDSRGGINGWHQLAASTYSIKLQHKGVASTPGVNSVGQPQLAKVIHRSLWGCGLAYRQRLSGQGVATWVAPHTFKMRVGRASSRPKTSSGWGGTDVKAAFGAPAWPESPSRSTHHHHPQPTPANGNPLRPNAPYLAAMSGAQISYTSRYPQPRPRTQ